MEPMSLHEASQACVPNDCGPYRGLRLRDVARRPEGVEYLHWMIGLDGLPKRFRAALDVYLKGEGLTPKEAPPIVPPQNGPPRRPNYGKPKGVARQPKLKYFCRFCGWSGLRGYGRRNDPCPNCRRTASVCLAK